MSWEAWGDPPEPPPMEECPDCCGTGIDSDDEDEPCFTCDGDGEVEIPDTRFDDDVI